MAKNRPKKLKFSVFALVITTLLALLQIPLTIKSLFPDKPNPQILGAQNCFIEVTNADIVWFELLVNNAGEKDCSITSIILTWPDGINADLNFEPSTKLPKIIPAGITERVVERGFAYKMDGFKPEKRVEFIDGKAEATATIIFNTKHKLTHKIVFTAKCP